MKGFPWMESECVNEPRDDWWESSLRVSRGKVVTRQGLQMDQGYSGSSLARLCTASYSCFLALWLVGLFISFQQGPYRARIFQIPAGSKHGTMTPFSKPWRFYCFSVLAGISNALYPHIKLNTVSALNFMADMWWKSSFCYSFNFPPPSSSPGLRG